MDKPNDQLSLSPMDKMRSYFKVNDRVNIQQLLTSHKFETWFIVSLMKVAIDNEDPQMVILLRRYGRTDTGLREYVENPKNRINPRCIQAVTHTQPYYCYQTNMDKACNFIGTLKNQNFVDHYPLVNELMVLYPILIQILFDDKKVPEGIFGSLLYLVPDAKKPINIMYVEEVLKDKDNILQHTGSIPFLNDLIDFYTHLYAITEWLKSMRNEIDNTKWKVSNWLGSSPWKPGMPDSIGKIKGQVDKIDKDTPILEVYECYKFVAETLIAIKSNEDRYPSTKQFYTNRKNELNTHLFTRMHVDEFNLCKEEGDDSELLSDLTSSENLHF